MKVCYRSMFIIIFCCSLKVNAQESIVTNDLEMRNSFAISKKINNRWKVSLEEELRFTEDISRFDIFLSDLGVDYKINKHFSAGLNYRFYQNKNNDGNFKTQHRLSAAISYKQKFNRFTFKYRLQFQNKDEDFLSSGSENNVYNLRNKISVDYNIRKFKLDPYFQAELFRKYETDMNPYFNKVRWTLGASYPITKKSDIQLFYRIDNELNQSYPKNTYILGLGYKFSF
jgi:predicted porin